MPQIPEEACGVRISTVDVIFNRAMEELRLTHRNVILSSSLYEIATAPEGSATRYTAGLRERSGRDSAGGEYGSFAERYFETSLANSRRVVAGKSSNSYSGSCWTSTGFPTIPLGSWGRPSLISWCSV